MEEIVRDHLKGLDEFLIEHIISLIESDMDDLIKRDEDLIEQLSMFIQNDGEFCNGPDHANEILIALVEKLKPMNSENENQNDTTVEDTTSKLDVPIDFSSMDMTTENYYAPENSYSKFINSQFTSLDPKKASKLDSKKSEKKKTETLTAAELDLDTIQIAASSDNGGSSIPSDISLSAFDLANKAGSGGDLLVNATVTIVAGRRYGLIGKNGCGKSTFLEALNDRTLEGMKWCTQSILLVHQEVVGNNLTPLEWVVASYSRPAVIRKRIEHLQNICDEESIQQLARLHEELSIIESTRGTTEAAKILFGLGFDQTMQNAPTKMLSGGWRRRVALACALFVQPQVLLLDEPTNHLDLETVLWLESYLTSDKFHGTLVVVSHDRNFLDAVVTDVIVFNKQQLTVYRGNYSAYLDIAEQERVTKARLREAQEMKRQHLQDYITKHAKAKENGPKAAKQRKSRMKKMERLGVEASAVAKGGKFKMSYDGTADEVEEEVDENEFELKFPVPPVTKGVVLRLDDVGFGYTPERQLFQGISVNFSMSSRAAILGRNGCGKSTLLRLLLRQIEPTAGSVMLASNCRVAYIAQHHSDTLNLDATPMEILLEKYPGDHSMNHENDMRRYLAQFGISGMRLPLEHVRNLSGGQKFRVALALAMYATPQFMILDEPSNHLDTETLNALIEALKRYAGGIVMVSHDEYLLQHICNEFYVMKNGKMERLNSDIATYKKNLLKNTSL